jgi:hypothetical protein
MNKEQVRSLIAQVDSVLWEVWDPIGVNDVPEARDEYTSYAPAVARLLHSGASDDVIQRHLATIILEQMGMLWVDPDRAERTVAALRGIPPAF